MQKKTFLSFFHFSFLKEGIRITKRQKFVFTVLLLSLGLFFSEQLFGRYFLFISLALSLMADLLFYAVMRQDVKHNLPLQMFILPFIYTLASALFYFFLPARLLTRIVWTFLYGIGLYSLFLSQNIFIVASIRTIALLSGARIVSFVLAFLSFGFLTKVIFSIEWPVLIAVVVKPLLLFLASLLLILQSIWTVTLEKSLTKNLLWAFAVSLCLIELSVILWFWPATSIFVAIFMTGVFYTVVGLTHAWFDKRLFRGVIWEYLWIGVGSLFILLLFTSWRG
jgi:hypothetical protein